MPILTRPLVATLLLGLGTVLATATAPPATAAAFTVTDADDDGEGTLRAAVALASAAGEDSTITIQAGLDPIVLTSGPLQYLAPHHLTINGNGATISGNETSRILQSPLTLASATFNDLTLRDGRGVADASFDGEGGAVAFLAAGPTVRFNRVTLLDNHSDDDGGAVKATTVVADETRFEGNTADGLGGAVWGDYVTLDESELVDNESPNAQGGAVWAQFEVDTVATSFTTNTALAGGAVYLDGSAALTATTSSFTANTATGGDGGAVYGDTSGLVEIDRSTFADNTAAVGGGAIVAQSVVAENSTFTNNHAQGQLGDGFGGAIKSRGEALLVHVTAMENMIDKAVGNDAEGAQVRTVGALTVRASFFSNPIGDDADNCVSGTAINSTGFNWADDDSCGTTADDFPNGGTPPIGLLTDNGGPTLTRHPIHLAAIIDVIPPAECTLDTDQRGVTRPQGAGCDIGAVEDVPPPPCGGMAVTVDLAEGDTPTAGDDVIRGTDAGETINGLGGNDRICGGGGADIINGGEGNDRLYGENGNDTLNGGEGDDRLFGGNGADTLNGGNGNDHLEGGSGNDRINGGNGNDTAFGGAGNDRIFGQNGNDTLNGQGGRDLLDGGPGRDRLNGGPQRDICRGGPGRDTQSGCEVRISIP